MRIIPFTKQGYESLKKNLEETISKRPEAVRQLSRGREMGDLSENGLYKAAKQELSDIDREIRNLKYLVKYGRALAPSSKIAVQIGHRIIVQTETGDKEFLMVGEYEADPKQNRISNKSPIGHALMGRIIDEEIIINTPRGKKIYKIKSIE